jgi:hypothetical protein
MVFTSTAPPMPHQRTIVNHRSRIPSPASASKSTPLENLLGRFGINVHVRVRTHRPCRHAPGTGLHICSHPISLSRSCGPSASRLSHFGPTSVFGLRFRIHGSRFGVLLSPDAPPQVSPGGALGVFFHGRLRPWRHDIKSAISPSASNRGFFFFFFFSPLRSGPRTSVRRCHPICEFPAWCCVPESSKLPPPVVGTPSPRRHAVVTPSSLRPCPARAVTPHDNCTSDRGRQEIHTPSHS